MNRIPFPTSIDAADAAAKPLLNAVKAKLGSAPNLFRLVGVSPAALEGYLGLSTALSKGRLDPATRERIALAVAGFNGCAYCTSAHAFIAQRVVGLDEPEILANRRGRSNDARAAAAVEFAVRVAELRGHVTDDDLAAVRRAGYSDAEVIEIVLHVALNTLTNFVNEVAQTPIDFPVARAFEAA